MKKNINPLELKFINYIEENKDFIINQKIAIGISGGPDSISLAILLSKYKNIYGLNLFAFTVDHQLRRESRDEAKYVKTLMNSLSIKHKILTWNKPHPKTNVLKLARITRYNLLAEACNEYDIDLLMLGHHQNDQVETFIIRLEANSGLDGLACMSDKTKMITDFRKLIIIRPLLNYKKNDLINICKSNNVNWIEDPSNFDLKYKRTKARKILANNYIYSDFIKVIKLYYKLKHNLDKKILLEIKLNINFSNIGMCQIKKEYFINLPYLFKEKLLNILVKIIGGKIYPRRTQVLKNIIVNILNDNKNYFTAGGVYFINNKDHIFLTRQPEPYIKKLIITSKYSIWDRRFCITNNSNKKNIIVQALGEHDYHNMVKLKKIQKSNIPFHAIKTLPSIRVLDEIVSIPHLLYWKDDFWKKNIKVQHIENELFNGCNKLYN